GFASTDCRQKYTAEPVEFGTPTALFESKAHAAGLLVDQADSGAAPRHLKPIRFDDARRALPVSRLSPTPFRTVDLDRQTRLPVMGNLATEIFSGARLAGGP